MAASNVDVGTVVAQWLRRCATNRKVAGSIPGGVVDIILPIALWPYRNECQEWG